MSAVDSQATVVPFSFTNGRGLGRCGMMFAGAGPTLSCRHWVAGCAGLPVTLTLQTKTFDTPAGLGKAWMPVAVDSNVTTPAARLTEGRTLSPSTPKVIWRTSLVSRLTMKIWRRDADAWARQTVSVGRQMNEPRASNATHTSLTSDPNGAVSMLGFAGAPVVVLVIWRRNGVRGGGQGVRWQLEVWSVPHVALV